jgi:hypothetical protein
MRARRRAASASFGIGRRGDLRQAVEHFAGALFRFSGEVGRLFRRQRELVGHAADGDDVDAQVHGLAGHFFARAGIGKGGTQRAQAAAADGGDGARGDPHQEHQKADFLEIERSEIFMDRVPTGWPTLSWRVLTLSNPGTFRVNPGSVLRYKGFEFVALQ